MEAHTNGGVNVGAILFSLVLPLKTSATIGLGRSDQVLVRLEKPTWSII